MTDYTWRRGWYLLQLWQLSITPQSDSPSFTDHALIPARDHIDQEGGFIALPMEVDSGPLDIMEL